MCIYHTYISLSLYIYIHILYTLYIHTYICSPRMPSRTALSLAGIRRVRVRRNASAAFVNSFQTTLTPNRESSINMFLYSEKGRKLFLNALFERSQVPALVVR